MECGFNAEDEWSSERFNNPNDISAGIFLYKLHGSIDWVRDSTTGILKRYDLPQENAELIFGTDAKMQSIDPFLFNVYELRNYSLLCKLIVIIGYSFNDAQIKSACVQIYRMLAKRDLTEKTLDFAKQMSVMPTAVKINNAKTRWGSCSSKKSLNFSWRLIMADDDVIDYVVVHELAHITEMNHSARFWSIVEGVLPDYRKRKTKLKELQRRLNGEDWE